MTKSILLTWSSAYFCILISTELNKIKKVGILFPAFFILIIISTDFILPSAF